MEAFQPSWKEESLDFQKEDFYESIRAPKWIDFTAPDSAEEPDDRAWFCVQAGCDQQHESVLEQTSHHSYLLKFQGSKSVNHNMTRLPAIENKSRTKARRASLSAPTLKGKDKTPGKVKPYFLSAGKIRQKQCLENQNPNSTPANNIANLDLKMKIDVTDDAEGFSTPKRLSTSADDMEASQNSPPHVFTGTAMDDAATYAIHSNPKHGRNRKTKPMGAFSTPRIKKCSVKPEPFRSIQSSSKGSNAATSMNTTRNRTTVVKSMVFQTPRKVMENPPSKDLTSLTKVCADLKKLDISGEINHLPGHFCRSSRCAANDPKYSSPASVPTKKYLAARSLQPNQASETLLLRSHTKSKGDAPSSSKSKDSRSLLRHPPSSHRRALFSEEDIQNEDLPGTSAQTLDLEQNKVKISTENDSSETQVKYLSEKSNLEEKFQTFQINVSVPLKGEEQQDSKLATDDVEISGFDILRNDLQRNRDRSLYIKDIPEVGRLMKNPISINHEQTGTNRQKPEESESEGTQNNLIKTEECESGVEEQVAICDKHWRLRVNETNSDKEAKSSDIEKPISEQDETDMPNNIFESLQQCFESLLKEEGESGMKNNSVGEVEIPFYEDRQNDAQSDFHGEPGKTNLEKRASEALLVSDAEDKGAVDETAIGVQFVSEAECEVRDVERKADESLEMKFNSEPDNRIVERPNEFLAGYAGGNRGAIESVTNVQLFSEAECEERGTEKRATGIPIHFDACNKQETKNKTNKDQFESDAEPDYREAAEGKVDAIVQLQSNVEPENILPIEDSNVNHQEHFQITAEVRVQNFVEDERDIMQGINKNEAEIGFHNDAHFSFPNGTSNSSEYFAQDLSNVGKSFLDSESESIPNFGAHSKAGKEHWEESKGPVLQFNYSDSRPEFDKGDLSSRYRENEDNKSDVEGSACWVETVKEPNSLQLEGSNGAIFCSDIGPECNEISSIPQSGCNKTSHWLVSKHLNSEVDSDMGSDCHENLQGSEETSSKRSSSDTILQENVIPVTVCPVNIAADATTDGGSIPALDSETCTTTNCIRPSRHEEMGSEDPSQSPEHEHMGNESGERDLFTSVQGKKRSSSDLNLKINCSKGELCQDEGCQSSGKVNSNSFAPQTSQDNGTSVLHVVKHKKPKTTCPKPFRLRTEERGFFKEASLSKKIEESIADKGSLPVFSVSSGSVNKTRHKGKYPRLEPSKPKKAKSEAIRHTKSLKLDKDKMNKVKPKQIEIPKSVKLEDNEEVKNALVKEHHAIKMPFFGQPFKPQRSTKKLTIPREPNFHPIHPKKDCTKGTSDLGHCKKQWID